MDIVENISDLESENPKSELQPIHEIYKPLFYVLNNVLEDAEKIARNAEAYPKSEFKTFIEPLTKLVSKVLDRPELGSFRLSPKKFTDILSKLKRLKAPNEQNSEVKTAAGVLLPLIEAFLIEVYGIADKANEVQFPSDLDKNRTKRLEAAQSGSSVSDTLTNVFLGFRPINGEPLVSVDDPALCLVFSRIYTTPYLMQKFIDPNQGVHKNHFKKFGLDLDKKMGRPHEGHHQIFERGIVVAFKKNPGDAAYTWYLNPEYDFVFSNPVH